jgi:hypothetical protein
MLNRKTIAFTLLLSAFLSTSCSKQKSQDPSDDEGSAGSAFVPWDDHPGVETAGSNNFADLMNNYAVGRPLHDPWDSTYWPYTANGIADSNYSGGGSPAGKYDAVHGNTTQAQEWEVKNHGAKVPKVQGWWGHCNGWSATASLYKEPPEVMRVDGIDFSRADIKGLLTEAGMLASADYFGEKVDPLGGDDPSTPDFQDIAPDQYFLVLTNYMGAKKFGVNIDRFTGNEIWNQPLAGYKIEYPTPADYLGADPSNPNVYRINVVSTLWWSDDSFNPDDETPAFNWQGSPESNDSNYPSRRLYMEMWLDGPVVFDSTGKITSSGNVIVMRHPNGKNFIGGNWHDEQTVPYQGVDHTHPDFMWVPYSLMSAQDPDINKPDSPDENIYIDYTWVVNHFINGAPDDPGAHPAPVQSPPSPDSSNTPTPTPSHTFPDPFPTHTPRPTPTPDPTSQPPVGPPHHQPHS